MRGAFASVLAMVVLAAACGGRYASEGDGSGGSNSGGQSSNHAGKGSAQAGKTNVGASSSVGGGAPVGATGNTAGTGCFCPEIGCGPGFVPQPSPDGCCDICVPLDCSQVMCPGIGCPSTGHLEFPPNQCCPICVPGNCDQQRASYFEFRGQLVEKYGSIGCMKDSDCGLLYEGNACGTNCGAIALPLLYLQDASVNLTTFADSTCTACPPEPVPPCEPALPPVCFNGRCQQVGFL